MKSAKILLRFLFSTLAVKKIVPGINLLNLEKKEKKKIRIIPFL